MATPRSVRWTAFWIATVRLGMTKPRPVPRATSAVSITGMPAEWSAAQARRRKADGRDDEAADGEHFVAAGASHQPSAGHRRDDDAAHHGRHHQTGMRGRGVQDQLEEERQINQAAKEGHGVERDDGDGDEKHAIVEQAQRQDRLRRAPLLPDQRSVEEGGDDCEPEDDGREPRVSGAAPTQKK